jgi:hypothetical protein
MSVPKTMTEWIRLVATPEDKALLDAITEQTHEKGFSTTVRRLIREEADRLNIQPDMHREPVTQ